MRPEYGPREFTLQEKQESLSKLLRIATGNHGSRIDDWGMEIGRNLQHPGNAVESKRVSGIDDAELGVAALHCGRGSANVQRRDDTAFQIGRDASRLQRGIRVHPGRGELRVGYGDSARVIGHEAGEIGQRTRKSPRASPNVHCPNIL